MKCPKCQFENPDGMNLCGEGGVKPERLCLKCDYSNSPQFKFCRECGQLHLDQVESLYGQAMALAEELGMRPLVAQCHRGLGLLYRRAGEKERGREQLTKAIRILKKCGADDWAEKYVKELAAL